MFKIRKYKVGDENQILKLDRLVEEHKWNRRNLSNWFWKFKQSPNTVSPIVYVCEYKKKIIGTFSTIPINYYINGKKNIFANSIAMIVHPKFQDKGIIKYLGDKLLEETKQKTLLVFGYPNERSYKLHKVFFGYKDVFLQKLYELNNFKNYKVKNFNHNLIIKPIKKFSNIFDKISKKNKKKFYLQTVRDQKYLNWRYASRPDKKYYNFELFDISTKKVVGYLVCKLYKFEKKLYGHIIDIYLDKSDIKTYKASILIAMNFFKSKKISDISLWCNADKTLISVIKSFGFIVTTQRPMICRTFNKKINQKKLIKDWYFTMGDSLEIY